MPIRCMRLFPVMRDVVPNSDKPMVSVTRLWMKHAAVVLAALSGSLELGSVVYAALHYEQVWAPFLVLASFQLGQFGARLVLSGQPSSRLFVSILALAIVLQIVLRLADPLAFAITVALYSLKLNLLSRQFQYPAGSGTAKRGARVCGFALAAICLGAPGMLCVLACIWTLALVAESTGRSNEKDGAPERMGWNTLIGLTGSFLWHQVHYFLYYCAVVVGLVGAMHPIVAMVVFVFGWLSYIAMPHLIAPKKPVMSFCLGHGALVLILLSMMFLNPAAPVWSLLWILGGFAAGTVNFLKRHLIAVPGAPKAQLAYTEDIGHVVGAGTACLWVTLLFPVYGLFGLAALSAASATLLAGISSRRSENVSTEGAESCEVQGRAL